MSWIRLDIENKWNHLWYVRKGTTNRFEPPVDKITLKFPDGTIETRCMAMKTIRAPTGDMGNSYMAVSKLPVAIVFYHGVACEIKLDAVEVEEL